LSTSGVAAAWRAQQQLRPRECRRDDDGAKTNGRATQTQSLIGKRRKSAAADEPWGTISGAPSTAPSPSLISFPWLTDSGKNQTGRGEAVLPGLHGRAPARPRGCRARAQVGRTQQQGADGEGERRCSGRSGVTGGEQQGVVRWGGAPTAARPANCGEATRWRCVEARAGRG